MAMEPWDMRVSIEKCRSAKEILKVGFLEMKCSSFLDIIDEEKLVKISGCYLNQLMENDHFSYFERKNIRELRRINVNRGTAKKSGLKKKNAYKFLEDEITELQKVRRNLRIEKIELQREINEMSVGLISGHL
ncbi:hypothetical protein LOD99_3461 [Oopsacas minuta]|uniref:BZIP domain-containing protein n=1 Tax=Oopsacas minuta TaxID=111878 RepID=A0AAV7JXX8_9METZ|nr:hypothetical protein LOD99_3461 [Oopsacas minuta]